MDCVRIAAIAAFGLAVTPALAQQSLQPLSQTRPDLSASSMCLRAPAGIGHPICFFGTFATGLADQQRRLSEDHRRRTDDLRRRGGIMAVGEFN